MKNGTKLGFWIAVSASFVAVCIVWLCFYIGFGHNHFFSMFSNASGVFFTIFSLIFGLLINNTVCELDKYKKGVNIFGQKIFFPSPYSRDNPMTKNYQPSNRGTIREIADFLLHSSFILFLMYMTISNAKVST